MIRSKRKTVAIRILPDGGVEVRAPLRAPKAAIDAFVREKTGWIQQKTGEVLARAALYPRHAYRDGERFSYLGGSLYLTMRGGIKHVVREEDSLLVPAGLAPERVESAVLSWYKNTARAVFLQRLDHFAPLCKVAYNSLKLSSAKSRWGSCGRDGNVNLNWRLIMAPLDMIDYVIVHELCHIKEPNHQAAFWSSVQSVLPDYRERQAWLRAHQPELEA